MTPFSVSNINSINSHRLGLAGREIATNDPVLKAFIDWVMLNLTGRTRSGLSNNGLALADLLSGVASGMSPESKNSVSSFGLLNEALSSIPLILESGNGKSASIGSGINTITIAQQIAKDIQNRSNLTDGFHGLSPSLAMGMAGNVIKKNKDYLDDIIDLEFGTTSSKVKEQLKGLTDSGNIARDSDTYKKIDKMANAMAALELHNAAIGDISTGLKKKLKSEGFSEEDILAADKARSGTLSGTFLDERELSSIRDSVRRYSDVVKSMSELFNTEDFRQLEQQAKQLGINSIASWNGANQIRKLTKEAVSSALMTGRTTDEILKDMGSIASITAASNGGRTSFAEVIRMQNVMDTVHLSEVSGSGNSIYTTNEKLAVAQNQVLEANDILKYVYAAKKGIDIGFDTGTITSDEYYEVSNLIDQLSDKNLQNVDPSKVKSRVADIVRQVRRKARSLGIDVDDKNLQMSGIADKDVDYTDALASAYGRADLEKNIKKELKRSGIDATDSDVKQAAVLADTLFSATGMNDTLFEDTIRLLNSRNDGTNNEYQTINMMVNKGYTEEEALSLLNSVGNPKVLQAIMNVRNRRRANLRSEGTVTKRQKQDELNARFIAENSDLTNARGQTGSDFLAGFLGEDGYTTKEKAAMYAMRLIKSQTLGEFSNVEKDDQDRLIFSESDLSYGGELQKIIAPNVSSDDWSSIVADPNKLEKKLGEANVRMEYDPGAKSLKMVTSSIDDVTTINGLTRRNGSDYSFSSSALKYGGDLQRLLAPEMSRGEWETQSRDQSWVNQQLRDLKNKGYEVDTSDDVRAIITNKLTKDGDLVGKLKIGRRLDGTYNFEQAPEELKKFGGKLYNLIGKQMSEEEWNNLISDDAKLNKRLDDMYKLRYSSSDNELKLYNQNIHKIGQLGTDGKLIPGSANKDTASFLRTLFDTTDINDRQFADVVKSGIVDLNDYINEKSGNKYTLTLGDNGEVFIVNAEGAEDEYSSFYRTDKSRGMAMLAAFGEDVDIDKKTGTISGKIGERNFVFNDGAEGDPKELAKAVQDSVTAKKFASVLLRAAEGDVTAQKARDAYLYEITKNVAGPARAKELNDIKTKTINIDNWASIWKKGMGIDIGNIGYESRNIVGTSNADAQFLDKTDKILKEHINKVGDHYVMKDDSLGRSRGDKLSESEYNTLRKQIKENIEVAANISKNYEEIKERQAGPGGEDSQGKLAGIMDNIYKRVVEIANKINVNGGIRNATP